MKASINIAFLATLVLVCLFPRTDATFIRRLPGPTTFFINVTNVDFGAYPPVAADYIEAARVMLQAAGAQQYLLFPRLSAATSIKYTQGTTDITLAVEVLDLTGALVTSLTQQIVADQVNDFVRSAKLQGSRARIYLGTRSNAFYCIGSGPDAVYLLC